MFSGAEWYPDSFTGLSKRVMVGRSVSISSVCLRVNRIWTCISVLSPLYWGDNRVSLHKCAVLSSLLLASLLLLFSRNLLLGAHWISPSWGGQGSFLWGSHWSELWNRLGEMLGQSTPPFCTCSLIKRTAVYSLCCRRGFDSHLAGILGIWVIIGLLVDMP